MHYFPRKGIWKTGSRPKQVWFGNSFLQYLGHVFLGFGSGNANNAISSKLQFQQISHISTEVPVTKGLYPDTNDLGPKPRVILEPWALNPCPWFLVSMNSRILSLLSYACEGMYAEAMYRSQTFPY